MNILFYYQIDNDDLKEPTQEELCYLLQDLKIGTFDNTGEGGWKIALEALEIIIDAEISSEGISYTNMYVLTDTLKEISLHDYLNSSTIVDIEDKIEEHYAQNMFKGYLGELHGY